MNILNLRYIQNTSKTVSLDQIQVYGVDLSPIQPSLYVYKWMVVELPLMISLPPNCIFEIDDIEEPWTYKYKFDFLHLRMMTGSITDWQKCFHQCYE